MNTNIKQLSEDYLRIEQAVTYLESHYKDQPSLEELAANIGLSEFHFQRLFTRWAGVSPKRFLNSLPKKARRICSTVLRICSTPRIKLGSPAWGNSTISL